MYNIITNWGMRLRMHTWRAGEIRLSFFILLQQGRGDFLITYTVLMRQLDYLYNFVYRKHCQYHNELAFCFHLE